MFIIIKSKEASQVKWREDPSKIKRANMNNVKKESNRYIRDKFGYI
jgi:hypothetical protein